MNLDCLYILLGVVLNWPRLLVILIGWFSLDHGKFIAVGLEIWLVRLSRIGN